MLDWMSKTMHALSQDSRENDFTLGQTVITPLHDITMTFHIGIKSYSATVTGVKLHRFDLLRYEILCWYHINKYRATGGNYIQNNMVML